MSNASETKPPQPIKVASAATVWAVVFLSAAVLVALTGLGMAYRVTSIVGGDAYNYQIAAARGIAIIGVGIVLALIGVALMTHGAVRGPRDL